MNSLNQELRILVKDKDVCFQEPLYLFHFDLNDLEHKNYFEGWFFLTPIQKALPGGKIRLLIYSNKPQMPASARLTTNKFYQKNTNAPDFETSIRFFLVQRQIFQKKNFNLTSNRNSNRNSKQYPKLITPKKIPKNTIRTII